MAQQRTLFDVGVRKVENIQQSAAYVPHKICKEVRDVQLEKEALEIVNQEQRVINKLYQKVKSRPKSAAIMAAAFHSFAEPRTETSEPKTTSKAKAKRVTWSYEQRVLVLEELGRRHGNVNSTVNYLKHQFPNAFLKLNESTVRSWFERAGEV